METLVLWALEKPGPGLVTWGGKIASAKCTQASEGQEDLRGQQVSGEVQTGPETK